MTTYRAELPWTLSPEEIEDLRGLGKVEFTLEIEGPSRADVVRELGDEFEWRGWGRDFWDDRLSGRRTRRGERA